MNISSLLFWKNNRKHGKDAEYVSSAEQACRDYITMSARERKKMMKRVIRGACEDQMKILRQ